MVCTGPRANHYNSLVTNPVIIACSSCQRTSIFYCSTLFEGDSSAGVPPVPIPNTDVKPCSADGTAHAVE